MRAEVHRRFKDDLGTLCTLVDNYVEGVRAGNADLRAGPRYNAIVEMLVSRSEEVTDLIASNMARVRLRPQDETTTALILELGTTVIYLTAQLRKEAAAADAENAAAADAENAAAASSA